MLNVGNVNLSLEFLFYFILLKRSAKLQKFGKFSLYTDRDTEAISKVPVWEISLVDSGIGLPMVNVLESTL